MSVSDRPGFSSWSGPAQISPTCSTGTQNGHFSTEYKPNPDLLAMLQTGTGPGATKPVGQRCIPSTLEKKQSVQMLEEQLETLIDEELAAAVPLDTTNPEDDVSCHMQASTLLYPTHLLNSFSRFPF
jgi:hypothetical protein